MRLADGTYVRTCYANNTDIGRAVCNSLQAQGWVYNKGTQWGLDFLNAPGILPGDFYRLNNKSNGFILAVFGGPGNGRPASGPCTFLGTKKYQKMPAPGSHKNHFQAGNFITRAGFAPRSNNKISFPLERLFVDGTKGADKRPRLRLRLRLRPRHKRKRIPFLTVLQGENSVVPLVVLTGRGKGGQPLALDLFFFFDKFWLWTKFIKKPTRRGKTPDLR